MEGHQTAAQEAGGGVGWRAVWIRLRGEDDRVVPRLHTERLLLPVALGGNVLDLGDDLKP